MVFEVTGKVALVTGGASGLGLKYAKELLQNGAKGVTLADTDTASGKRAEEDLNKTFGEDRAIFIKTDVSKYAEFEDAFKATINKFKNVDILINNAGIMNDSIWEKEVAVNMNGIINGMLLGLEKYLKNSKQGPEAVIVNISSIMGLNGHGYMPVYCGTKAAVVSMTQAWAWPDHYKRTGVRVVALCPGPSETPLMDMRDKCWSPEYMNTVPAEIPLQGLEIVAQELIRIIKFAENGTIWVVEQSLPAYKYITPDREIFTNNFLTEK